MVVADASISLLEANSPFSPRLFWTIGMATPSVIIIPARAIHTSQDVGADGPESSLYDIFCPPRMDFAAKPGFVINEDEYPLPETTGEREIKTGGTLLSWQKPA